MCNGERRECASVRAGALCVYLITLLKHKNSREDPAQLSRIRATSVFKGGRINSLQPNSTSLTTSKII